MIGIVIERDFRKLAPATQAELRRIAVAMVRVGKTHFDPRHLPPRLPLPTAYRAEFSRRHLLRHFPYVDGPLLARYFAWPRWFPRREFHTQSRPCRGPLENP